MPQFHLWSEVYQVLSHPIFALLNVSIRVCRNFLCFEICALKHCGETKTNRTNPRWEMKSSFSCSPWSAFLPSLSDGSLLWADTPSQPPAPVGALRALLKMVSLSIGKMPIRAEQQMPSGFRRVVLLSRSSDILDFCPETLSCAVDYFGSRMRPAGPF